MYTAYKYSLLKKLHVISIVTFFYCYYELMKSFQTTLCHFYKILNYNSKTSTKSLTKTREIIIVTAFGKSHFQTLKVRQKYSIVRRLSTLGVSVFGNVMKHSLLVLTSAISYNHYVTA